MLSICDLGDTEDEVHLIFIGDLFCDRFFFVESGIEDHLSFVF